MLCDVFMKYFQLLCIIDKSSTILKYGLFVIMLSSPQALQNSLFWPTSKSSCVAIHCIGNYLFLQKKKFVSSLQVPWNPIPYPNVVRYFSDNTVSKTNEDVNAIFISGIPNILLEEAGSILHAELTGHIQSEIQNFWVYSEKSLVVVKVDSGESVNRILQVCICILKFFFHSLSILADQLSSNKLPII